MIERLNDYDQQRVLGVVKAAAVDVSKGANPNTALSKHASSARLSKDLVKRACESFNVSKTLAHLGGNEGTKRAESFLITDPNKVAGIMWPEKVAFTIAKGTFSEDVFNKPMRKAASYDGEEPKLKRDNIVLDAVGEQAIEDGLDRIKEACERALEDRRVISTTEYQKLNNLFDKTASYFKELYSPDFEKFANWAFGKYGVNEVDTLKILGASVSEKRANSGIAVPAQLKKDYFCLKTQIHKTAAVLSAYQTLKTEASSLMDRVKLAANMPLDMNTLGPVSKIPGMEQGGNFMMSLMQDNPRANSQRRENISYNPFSDPLVGEVAQTREMLDSALALHDAMQNDDVLASADPKEVLSNYNDIFANAPGLVRHPALLKATLRNATEYGGLDATAMNAILKTHKDLGDTKDQAGLISELGAAHTEKSKSNLDALGDRNQKLTERMEKRRSERENPVDKQQKALDLDKAKEEKYQRDKKNKKDEESENKPIPKGSKGKSNKGK